MNKSQQEQYEKDIESVIRFLKITDPENATREHAIEMLGNMESLAHLIAHEVIKDEDYVEYKKQFKEIELRSVDEIYAKANDLTSNNNKWHFHILTPVCKFNKSKKYSLILENLSENEIFYLYSETPHMDVGKKLLNLLHGDLLTKPEGTKVQLAPPSMKIQNILESVADLNSKGINWHHHMLFPKCKFNNYDDKWVITLEIPRDNKVIEAIYDDEPTSDLKYLEKLFYSQNKPE